MEIFTGFVSSVNSSYLIKYYKEKLYTTEERENILLSILDENKRKINSRVFKGHEETERLHLHGIVWGIGTDKLIIS